MNNMSALNLPMHIIDELKTQNEILVHRDLKHIRGALFEIYMDSTFLVMGRITSSGLNIPTKLNKWFNLPKLKNEKSISVKIDFILVNDDQKKFLNAPTEISGNNYGTYIKLRDVLTTNKITPSQYPLGDLICCKISFDLDDLDFVLKKSYRDALNIIQNSNLNLKFSTLIISGSHLGSDFDIYLNQNKQVIIRQKGITSSSNNLYLSTEIKKYITNLTDYNHKFLCKINNDVQMIVDSSVIQNKEKGLKKNLILPYLNPTKMIEVLITNPELKLSEIAHENYKMKLKLRKNGLPITSFKQNTSPKSDHMNKDFEIQARKLIQKVVLDLGGKSFSEVKLERENKSKENQLSLYNHVDELGIVDFGKKQEILILFEIKSSVATRHKSKKIDRAIAKILNFSRKLNSKNVIPILIVNEDFRYNNEIITEEYGSKLNMILIGQYEFQNLVRNPMNFVNKIKAFDFSEKSSSQNKKKKNLVTSKITNEVILKYKIKLSEIINHKAKIIALKKQTGIGSVFEKCIARKYEESGYEVVNNLIIQLYNRKMEIDVLAMNNNNVILISCKNMSQVKKIDYLTQRIKESANLIEHRANLLGIDSARVHVKVNSSVFPKIKEKFNGSWSSKLLISIEK